jgi:hypothetical protein
MSDLAQVASTSEAIQKKLEAGIKKQKDATTKAAGKRAKVASKTNFDNTYADITFPFVFNITDSGNVETNLKDVASSVRSAKVKIRVSTVKLGGIDSTAGLSLNADGTPKGEHSGFGTTKRIKVWFKTKLVPRKGTTKNKSSAKVYVKDWKTLSVPKSATSTDIYVWISKNWKNKPQQFQMGERVYQVTPSKKAYNNPSVAASNASDRGKNNTK